MKLSNGASAVISKDKLTDYLLSKTHPVGSAKAKFFRKLGFNESNVSRFKKSLLKIAATNDIKDVRKIIYGTNYVIEGIIKTPTGKLVTIVTVWFIKQKKSRPSFVTAYPV